MNIQPKGVDMPGLHWEQHHPACKKSRERRSRGYKWYRMPLSIQRIWSRRHGMDKLDELRKCSDSRSTFGCVSRTKARRPHPHPQHQHKDTILLAMNNNPQWNYGVRMHKLNLGVPQLCSIKVIQSSLHVVACRLSKYNMKVLGWCEPNIPCWRAVPNNPSSYID